MLYFKFYCLVFGHEIIISLFVGEDWIRLKTIHRVDLKVVVLVLFLHSLGL